MHIIHINQVGVSYASREVFKELTYAIGDRHRVGLVGPNGAGKSTLMKIIAGKITPDSGSVTTYGKVRIGYLAQEVELPDMPTLIETAMVLPPTLKQLDVQLSALEAQLGVPDVYGDSDRLQAVLEKQEQLMEVYERHGGMFHASRVRELLARLGFTPDDYDLPTASLSGGQKKLVALVRLAVEQPEALLLDEPDNHLDMHSKRYLEQFINKYNGAVVIVSHDRYLLDETVTHIAELEAGKLTLFTGNYSQYATQKELDRLRQEKMYTAQQKRITQIEEAIARFEMWGKVFENERAVIQARSRRKMLERMEENGEIIEKPTERRLMDLQIDGWRGSTQAIEFQQVSMAFGDDPLFFDLDLLVRHGERVGLIGPNGAGKSVLFKLILGEYEPIDGVIKVGPSTKIGYYAQEHQTLDGWSERTPVDRVRDVRAMPEGAAVNHLLRMAFTYEQCRQRIGTLSGGERSRLQLLCLMLEKPNLLLLDEPTNNLDIKSAEVLESVMGDFEGSVLVISHDRYFLDRVVDRVVELENGSLTPYLGGYTDYLEAKGVLTT